MTMRVVVARAICSATVRAPGGCTFFRIPTARFHQCILPMEVDALNGIGGYVLGNPDACIIAYDYSSSGHEDYLLCYRTAGNASTITVTVQNYANVAVAVVQNKQVLVTLPPAPSSTQPSSAQVQVDSTAEVLLQEPGNWYAVLFRCALHVKKWIDHYEQRHLGTQCRMQYSMMELLAVCQLSEVFD